MLKNITYLIGAGASANAIPMMRSLPKAMRYFFEELKLVLYSSGDFDHLDEHLCSEYEKLLIEIERFGTPDIVAKINYFKDDIENLERIKNLLSCYMVVEQLEERERYIKDLSLSPGDFDIAKAEIFGKDPKDRLPYLIHEVLDNRYVEFLSSILTGARGNLQIPENVNIVSWNYDHQLEKALSVFSERDLFSVQRIFGVFPMTNLNYYNKLVPDIMASMRAPKIIKLNGTAGFGHNKKPSHTIFDFTTRKMDREAWKTIGEYLFNQRALRYEINQLAFAWEESSLSNVAQSVAQKHIGSSDVVVVIGYSFPNFNRQVDRKIFQDFEGSKIYIQDPYADDIIQKLDGIKKDLKGKAEPVKSGGAFTLPNEFWE